ncbi:hypothetical protein EZV73_16715 [Acidaminobacter sp. JC074]|uniref:flavin reductase family protein n=1 Tax=Acidaminobacter sp. JC074 TaxID=2530199 RepID=UPI001F109F7D|nr:flavin reductase family protein [Acidaminobacter sp. JC074]MCH4889241.1 hypothetical protein [Acidaminobacter sp. JC074]
MKKSIGINTFLFPLPSVVVNTYDESGKANMMTASWTGVVNSSPSMISVSLRQATYTHDLIIKRQAFTVSIPSKEHVLEMDYVGTLSGKRVDKFDQTGLTPIKSDLVDAPYVSEFPLTLECKLVKYEKLGLHTLFIAEVVDVKIDEAYLNEKGMPDMKKIDPVAYAHGEREYYEIGNYIGKANKMWQSTLLNEVMNTEAKKDIIQLVEEYYEKMDTGQPFSEFIKLINWSEFVMINGDLKLDSPKKYASWYSDVLVTMFNRKHTVEKLTIDSVDDKTYKVKMDMHFRANEWTPGEATSKTIQVRGKIEWLVSRDPETSKMRIDKYTIKEA